MIFLSAPFRPLFLFTGLSAVIYPMFIVANVMNDYWYGGEAMGVTFWHAHEMLFGFLPALLSGFILTASSHWTGRESLKGIPLLALVSIWLIGRIAMFNVTEDFLLTSILASAYLPLVIGRVAIKLRGNKNQVPVTAGLVVLFISQLVFWFGMINDKAGFIQAGIALGPYVALFFLTLFSGRLLPFFINSKVGKQVVFSYAGLEKSVLMLIILAGILEITFGTDFFPLVVVLFVLFGIMVYRGYRYFTKELLREPMILSLYLANVWLILYYLIHGLELMLDDMAYGKAATHALGAGAIGLFALSIMSRASLGHTGRPIKACGFIQVSFVCVFIGAVLRVFVPILRQETFDTFLHVSMGFWTLGYILFLLKFTPYYMAPRADS